MCMTCIGCSWANEDGRAPTPWLHEQGYLCDHLLFLAHRSIRYHESQWGMNCWSNTSCNNDVILTWFNQTLYFNSSETTSIVCITWNSFWSIKRWYVQLFMTLNDKNIAKPRDLWLNIAQYTILKILSLKYCPVGCAGIMHV